MNIETIRGDTKKLKFQRKSTTNEVITEKPDKMYFTVKTGYYSKDYLFQKRLDTDIIYKLEGSQGYLIEVYNNGIYLKGYDFVSNKYVAIAQYFLDV